MLLSDTPADRSAQSRRLPVGAEPVKGGLNFRLWAPRRREVEVVFDRGPAPLRLTPQPDGYFAGHADGVGGTALYRFRLDGSDYLYPDPVSRFQPDGPHGPSQVIDPTVFRWTDQPWKGVTTHGQVLYEMHVGTFTKEGTYAAAAHELPALKELGVTCIEMMPVNEFAGRWGWGYDGVALFAPFHHYGSTDDLRAFIDTAHALGIGVILDLVYNHLGPDGNYLREFSEDYFSHTHHTDWGDALNFDGPNSRAVREFFLANALHWITEYHFDGFRFDATQAIVDDSPEHILSAVCRECRNAAAQMGRSIYIINENEPQHTRLVRPREQGGYGMDALWNDDFHHSAMVTLSGHNEAYYTDYHGTPQEMISAAKWGYLYQGQRYTWQKKRRGTPALDLPPTAFVHFLQNHDQIANFARGYRVHQMTSPGHLKAMTALLLLMPQTPMLFQGQEYAADQTFHYFSDHNAELQKLIYAGRARELSQFPSVASAEMQACLIDPGDEQTFLRCKLDHSQREQGTHRWIWDLHRDLLRLRREEAAFRRVQRRGDVDGAVLGEGAFLLRFFAPSSADERLLLVNFARDLELSPAPEPLLAPPPAHRWHILWSSEDPKYGGTGTPPPDTENEGWFLPGRCAVVLMPKPECGNQIQTRFRVPGSAQDAKRKDQNSACS